MEATQKLILFMKVAYSTSNFRISKSQLPNIYGHLMVSYNIQFVGGAITANTTSPSGYGPSFSSGGSGWTHGDVQFYASNYSDRYGNYTEVSPLYASCIFCIRY